MKRWFTWPRFVLLSIALLLFAAWYVQRISADRYREPIRLALENALGRKVEIGLVKFQLFPMPGFTVNDVSIGEDPAVGPEPTAYVTTLRARPAIAALFGGPLAFASVTLEDASVNLTRVDLDQTGVRWNFSSLMRPKLLAAFPDVHLSKGRVNFKFGDTKSIFYLLETDVDLAPPAKADGPWTLHMRGQPARTDRPARGFGFFVADGEWRTRDGQITLDVKLEKSELGDMVTLFEGHESGLHGHILGTAHLAGPLSRVGVAGSLTVDDVHGWNQVPPGGRPWPIALGGAINVPGQVIEIRATSGGQPKGLAPPIDLRYRVTDYLRRPRWAVTALVTGLPMAPLMGLARNLGWGIPPDLSFDGTAAGAVGYSMPEGMPRMDGEVAIADSTLAVAGSPPLRIPRADLRFSGSGIYLSSTAVTNTSGETAMLEGTYDTASDQMDASLSSDGMSIASLRRQISLAAAPLLSQATAGSWRGKLRYAKESGATTGVWAGDIHLSDTDVPCDAFNQPLRVVAADATIDGAAVVIKKLSFTVSGIEGQGEYRYEPAAPHPHRFRVALAKVDGQVLEKLLTPALHRGSFLNYALNLGRVPEPDWMRAMHADGTVQAASLDLGDQSFTRLKARVLWDGEEVRLTGLQAQSGEAAFDGAAAIHLAQRQPRYEVSGKLAGLPWRSGTLDAEGTLKTSGMGRDLIANMSAQGSFTGRNIDLTPLDTYDAINGGFEWSWDVRNPRLRLTQLIMTAGGDTWQGSAETQDNGQLLLRISSGTKQVQAAGALLRGDALKPIAP